MKKITTFLFAAYICFHISAQVGINRKTPQRTLDVNGSSYTNSLYLRNPGEPDKTGGHFLATSKNTLDLYDSCRYQSVYTDFK
ncbi:hypothetical protein [Chryseobacterium antibioticum]|uniref:hypothetical protein n=1 Tax=Chryseobacterium antibioticum TaxID=2728847 RepID=UPI001E58CAE0|nr:hypothetical protein [Chryseobacterium antibioticum]